MWKDSILKKFGVTKQGNSLRVYKKISVAVAAIVTRWNLVDLTRGAFLIFIFSMVGACSRTAALHFSGQPNQESARKLGEAVTRGLRTQQILQRFSCPQCCFCGCL